MASIVPACDWHLYVEEAASIISKVITPLFLETTRAINNGNMPALVAQPEEEWDSLGIAMERFTEVLIFSPAWHQVGSRGLHSQHTQDLLRERETMVTACFATTTAALNSNAKHNSGFSIINPRYWPVLKAALHALSCWFPYWPSGNLLSSQQTLASLDHLLRSILAISRKPPTLKFSKDEFNELVVRSAYYMDWFMSTVAMLPGPKLLHTITSLPAPLISHMFNLLDEHLLVVVCCEGHSHIGRIVEAMQYIIVTLVQLENKLFMTLCTALGGLSQHLLVVCVSLRRVVSSDSSFTPEARTGLVSKALTFLYYKLQLIDSAIQSGGPHIQSLLESADSCHKPFVSEGRYFYALCKHAASSPLIRHSDCDTYAHLLIQQILQSSRTVSGALTITNTQRVGVRSLLEFLSRKAQQRMLPARKLKQQLQQQHQAANRGAIDADNLVLQSIFLDVCHVVMALTGVGVKAPLKKGYATFPEVDKFDGLVRATQQWLGTAGCSMTIEAHLRDPRMRGSSIDQHAAACIALMVLCASCLNTQLAVKARISLAATLRKLLHPASAPMWTAASASPECSTWSPTSKRSTIDAERSVLVINALSKRDWHFNELLDAELERKQGGRVASVTYTISNGSLVELCASQQIQRMSVILAATHVQLCKCSGNDVLGESAYLQGNPICPVATKLLRAIPAESSVAGGEAVVCLASLSWEKFAKKHFTGRLLPGCSHWGCTNLEGSSETALPTLLCSGCKRVRYCCIGCQRAGWVAGHREVCRV